MTAAEFAEFARDELQPGDVVLFKFARRRTIPRLIARCQRRMLRDLMARDQDCIDQCAELIAAAAEYTHAAMVSKCGQCIEMTSPKCRLIPWAGNLEPGDQLIIRRAVRRIAHGAEHDIGWVAGEAAAHRAALDLGRPYPTGEIVRYWLWSWGLRKLTLRRRFQEVFETEKSDVCSDSVWRWHVEVGNWPGIQPPESIPAGHYPGELVTNHRLRTVRAVRITQADAPAMSAGDDKQDDKHPDRRTTMSIRRPYLAFVLLLCAILALGAGCNTMREPDRTIYAGTYIENQPESDANNVSGSVGSGIVDNVARSVEVAGEPAGAETDGVGAEAARRIRTAGVLNINGNSMAMEKDVTADAMLLRQVEDSQAGMTGTTAQRQSTASGTGTTQDQARTPTVKTLTDNAVQTPVAPQGSAQTGDLQQQSPSSTGGGGGTQTTSTDKSVSATCPTCGAKGVSTVQPTVAADGTRTWTCEMCGTVIPWATENCTKAGCDNCRDCQPNTTDATK